MIDKEKRPKTKVDYIEECLNLLCFIVSILILTGNAINLIILNYIFVISLVLFFVSL